MSDSSDVLADLHYQRRGWEKLIETPEWGTLIRVLQDQADALQAKVVFTPLTRGDDIYLQEFMKGQLEGRLSISNTVETLMEQLDVQIRQLTEVQNES